MKNHHENFFPIFFFFFFFLRRKVPKLAQSEVINFFGKLLQ